MDETTLIFLILSIVGFIGILVTSYKQKHQKK